MALPPRAGLTIGGLVPPEVAAVLAALRQQRQALQAQRALAEHEGRRQGANTFARALRLLAPLWQSFAKDLIAEAEAQAVAIASSLSRPPHPQDADALLERAALALQGLKGVRQLTLRLCPEEAAVLLNEPLPPFVRVEADAGLGLGDLILQTERGRVDRRLYAQASAQLPPLGRSLVPLVLPRYRPRWRRVSYRPRPCAEPLRLPTPAPPARPSSPSRWPTPLPRPAYGLEQGVCPLSQALTDEALLTQAAMAWAHSLQLPIELSVAPGPPPGQLPQAAAGWVLGDGQSATLTVDLQLISGQVMRLTGVRTATEPKGPVPLTPAEEGLFAFLALSWLKLLPGKPRLNDLYGGDPTWPAPPRGPRAVCWRLCVGDQVGTACWWLPAAAAAPAPIAKLPVALVVGARVRLAVNAALRPGALLPLSGLRLWSGATPLFAVRCGPDGLTMSPLPPGAEIMPTLEALPVELTVELAKLTLPAGQIAALRPGQCIPLTLSSPPVVQVLSGDQAIATGVLVEDEQGLAIQLTRVRLP